MKYIGYILAFYLVMLAAVPCCAFDSCPDDKIGQATDHKQGDEDCGNCSPFFNCEGCATVSISIEPMLIEISSIPVSSVYSYYTPQQLPKVDYDFWQPPKIG